MGYECKIIADSINPQGDRITSFLVTYPRIIHAEMLRHRMLSRNSASSRAIPFERMVESVETDPFIPIAWQKQHKGMQGSEYITDAKEIKEAETTWTVGRSISVDNAKLLYYGKGFYEDTMYLHKPVTKQLCNRLLEPYLWHTELITGTDFENFFNLRCPQYELEGYRQGTFRSRKDAMNAWDGKGDCPNTDLGWYKINTSQAEIHIQKIAEMMWDSYNESKPKKLQTGQWHMPFGDQINIPLKGFEFVTEKYLQSIKLKVCTARAARLSYNTHNGEIDYEADIKLHDRLLESKHFSPFEHCARAMNSEEYRSYINGKCEVNPISEEVIAPVLNEGWCRNFRGWIPYRHLVEES